MLDVTTPRRFRTRPFELALTLSLTACLAAGDSALQVQGDIVDQTGLGHVGCALSMSQEGYGVVDTADVKSRFLVTFVIEPRLREYRFRIACKSAVSEFVSEPKQGGSLQTIDTPIDLGRIVLDRRPVP